ncbi:hypothetical protein CCP3SC1AL1_30059 [Gammaproteobacteria bacterium]
MAKDKKSFVLYCDQQGVFNKLPDEIAGRLIKHIFAYVNDENPPCDDLLLSIAFEPIQQSLKRDLKKYEVYIGKQKENGAKGGRPKKEEETQKSQPFFQEPKKADSVSVNVSVSENDNKKQRDVFIKPSIEEIKTYMTEIGMTDVSEKWFDYYESNGWLVGKNKMKNWKAAVRTWKNNNLSNNATTPQVINRNVFNLKDYDART